MKKVIVAQDVKAILEQHKSFLDRAGFTLFPAASNDHAFVLHKSVKADLIIAKLNSSEMSGEKLCSLIREDAGLRNASLILVCAEIESEVERCVACRANSFVSSPINVPVLLQEVRKLIHVSPRISCRIPMRVRVKGVADSASFTGFTDNISRSGMLFHTAAHLFEGDTVTCSFSLRRASRITVTAEIVRVMGSKSERGAGYGARFVHLVPHAASALGSVCRDDQV